MTQHFVLDKALILDRLGGDEEIFAMMVDLYLQDVDNYVQALSSALALAINSANSAVLSREAHTVKGLLATFSDDAGAETAFTICLLYTSPSPRDRTRSRMPSSA